MKILLFKKLWFLRKLYTFLSIFKIIFFSTPAPEITHTLVHSTKLFRGQKEGQQEKEESEKMLKSITKSRFSGKRDKKKNVKIRGYFKKDKLKFPQILIGLNLFE